MFEDESRGGWSVEALLVVGCIVGVLLGMGFVHAEFVVSPRTVMAGLFEANSGNALRVLQSVGILLPLFAGLLRFTTSDRSEVSERVNNHLLLGILGLVFAGASAVIAGMFTGMTGILKLSLLFVLFTFIVIGLAAEGMFGDLTTETGGNEDATKENDTDGETDDPKSARLKDAGENVSAKTATESEAKSKQKDEQAEDATEE